jgi:hypothetical protein
MFENVFDNLRKATDVTIEMQQELFKKWVSLFPTAFPAPFSEPMKIPKKWAEVVGELITKQRQALETQFSAGLRNIEEGFRVAQTKDPEELRAKTVELWQKTFDCLRQTYEAQTRDFQIAVGKWTELMTKGAA